SIGGWKMEKELSQFLDGAVVFVDEFIKDLVEAYQVVLLTTWPTEKVWEWVRSDRDATIKGTAPVIVWTCRAEAPKNESKKLKEESQYESVCGHQLYRSYRLGRVENYRCM